MKLTCLFLFIILPLFSLSKDIDWIKTEGVIIDITTHPGKKVRETATIKFSLKDGSEIISSTELTRIPFIGSIKSIGDKTSIYYDKNNPGIIQTAFGKFLADYGMYILIVLGIIFSIIPYLRYKKKLNSTA